MRYADLAKSVKIFIFLFFCVISYLLLMSFLPISSKKINLYKIETVKFSNQTNNCPTGMSCGVICDYFYYEPSIGWPVRYAEFEKESFGCKETKRLYPIGILIDIALPIVWIWLLYKITLLIKKKILPSSSARQS